MTQTPMIPHLSEYQTLEYILEYGGEGEAAALVRTTWQGRPRYWQLKRLFTFEDDVAVTTGSELVFLSFYPEQALRQAPHPWWSLVGLFVATDLLPTVEGILAEHGGSLDSWLLPLTDTDPHALTCKRMWPESDVTRRPVDAYWLTARPETMRRLLGGLTESQVEGLTRHPASDVGLLVDRKGRILRSGAYDYPENAHWIGHQPFVPHPPFSVHALSDIWNKA